MLANTARAIVACIGDSTTAGVGSSGSDSVDAKANAWPAALAGVLAATKIPSHANSFFGDGGFLGKFFGSDARIIETDPARVDWVSAINIPSLGGYPLANNQSTAGLVFAPSSRVDSVDEYDVTGPAGSGFNITGGGASVAIAPLASGAVTVRKTTARFALGTGPIAIANVQAGPTLSGTILIGEDAYDSTVKDVGVENLGWSGSQTVDWAAAGMPTVPLAALVPLAPTLTFIDLGINDMGQGVSTDNYKARMSTIIEAAMKLGDVVLIVPNRFAPDTISDAVQSAYASAVYDLAAKYSIPLFDTGKALGSYQDAKAAGYMFDGDHPSGVGYAVIAKGLAAMLTAN